MSTAPTTGPKRRVFRPVEVADVRRLTPRMVSVALRGEALAGFEIAAPTLHVKLLFPAPGQDAPTLPVAGPDGLRFPEGQARPVMRTFTPRQFDATTSTLSVEFVLHGEGPASAWAAQARTGHRIAVAGPGGRMPLPLGPGRWIVGGDESALPAIGTLLAALPASAAADVYVEVDDASDETPLESAAEVSTTWLHRRPGSFGPALEAAVTGAEVGAAAGIWVAGEANAVRRIRRALLDGRRVDPSALVTRGYWRLGEQDHPDHDYGEDAA
jgi:NADPH-dependent ferric siderophore reductase